MRDENRFEYDIQKRAKAGTAATLRAVISVYVIYLGWTVLKGVLNGTSPVPVWVGWLVANVFTAAAIAFGFYTWKTWRRDLEAARLPANDGDCEEAVEETEENVP